MNAACIQKRKNICSEFFLFGGHGVCVGGGRAMMMDGNEVVFESMVITLQFL